MRTKLSYEVVRDTYGFNTITDRGAVLDVTLGKNDTMDMVENFLAELGERTGYNFMNGVWENDNYCVGYIEMDRDDFRDVIEEYRDLKKEIKEGTFKLS